MESKAAFERVYSELEAGMDLAKCWLCGCMQDTLDQLELALASVPAGESQPLLVKIEPWKRRMKALPIVTGGPERGKQLRT